MDAPVEVVRAVPSEFACGAGGASAAANWRPAAKGPTSRATTGSPAKEQPEQEQQKRAQAALSPLLLRLRLPEPASASAYAPD